MSENVTPLPPPSPPSHQLSGFYSYSSELSRVRLALLCCGGAAAVNCRAFTWLHLLQLLPRVSLARLLRITRRTRRGAVGSLCCPSSGGAGHIAPKLRCALGGGGRWWEAREGSSRPLTHPLAPTATTGVIVTKHPTTYEDHTDIIAVGLHMSTQPGRSQLSCEYDF